MAKSNGSLYQRIRYIKSSLDNAEQSFLDNKSMRGELDLMLAEAEFKNLRRKKDVPWNWNRQLLACCAALMLLLAGFGGWYYAKDSSAPMPVVVSEQKLRSFKADTTKVTSEKVIDNRATVPEQPAVKAAPKEGNAQDVYISKAGMRKLVQSARVELSSSK